MQAGLLSPRPQETVPSKSWVWRASLRTWNSGWTRSVAPVKVVVPCAEWTVTRTPAVPLGASEGPQAVKIEIRTAAIVVRTGQWYGRGPLAQRRGGGTGRRVGLKNRCPQGRAGSTPALGTMPVLNGLDRHKVASRRRRS